MFPKDRALSVGSIDHWQRQGDRVVNNQRQDETSQGPQFTRVFLAALYVHTTNEIEQQEESEIDDDALETVQLCVTNESGLCRDIQKPEGCRDPHGVGYDCLKIRSDSSYRNEVPR